MSNATEERIDDLEHTITALRAENEKQRRGLGRLQAAKIEIGGEPWGAQTGVARHVDTLRAEVERLQQDAHGTLLAHADRVTALGESLADRDRQIEEYRAALLEAADEGCRAARTTGAVCGEHKCSSCHARQALAPATVEQADLECGCDLHLDPHRRGDEGCAYEEEEQPEAPPAKPENSTDI